MYRQNLILLASLLLSGCASNEDAEELDYLCYRGICGCWEDYTMRAAVKITDANSQPVPGLTLLCESTLERFGVTNESGIVRIEARGRASPGCGFGAKCEMAIIRNKAGATLGGFQLTPLLRGQTTAAEKYKIELVTESNRNSTLESN